MKKWMLTMMILMGGVMAGCSGGDATDETPATVDDAPAEQVPMEDAG